MKKLLLFLAVFMTAQTFAQVAPSPSPAASFTQVVGTTKISVSYSRPAVKGREIFGKLVPYGSIWRTGANSATQIETAGEIMVEGQKLPAGKYSIHTIPAADEWTVVFNKNANASTDQYKIEEDALRVKVKPATTAAKTESFTIDISDVSDEAAKMNFSWDNTTVSVGLKVDNETAVAKAVETQNNSTAGAMQQAADFFMNKGKFDQALSMIDKSIGLKETFRNNMIKSMILGKLGRAVEALPFAQKAMDLGKSESSFSFFKDAIEKNITDLKALIPAAPALPALPTGKKKK
jgi:Protein of unknown function (DUF2911)